MELAQLRNRVDAALIMVAHDQAEAMTLADRIVVISDCTIQQVGTPAEVYARPANAFVARFVGSPAMAMLPVEVVAGGADGLRVRLPGGAEVQTAVRADGLAPGARAELGLRPEHVSLAAPGCGGIPATVELVERLGDRTFIYARIAEGFEIIAHAPGFSEVRPGDAAVLAIDGAAAHVFTADGTAHHPEPGA